MSTHKPFEFFVQWHLTEACNLWCKHCYQGERSIEEMPLPDIKKTIAEISDMIDDWSEAYGVEFSRSMNITGGEPFLRRDCFDILGEIKKKGFEVSLLTNGTLVTRERAQRLADLGVDAVQVSMEGAEDVHDAIRGKGSYDAAVAGVEWLVDCGLAVTLNVTVSDLNAEQVKKVVAFGSHAGVKRIGFSRLVPAGKGRALLSQMLTQERLRELYGSLFSLELKSLEIVTGDPVATQMKIKSNGDAGDTAMSGCSAGVAGLTILPNGNVTPCRRLPCPSAMCERIRSGRSGQHRRSLRRSGTGAGTKANAGPAAGGRRAGAAGRLPMPGRAPGVRTISLPRTRSALLKIDACVVNQI